MNVTQFEDKMSRYAYNIIVVMKHFKEIWTPWFKANKTATDGEKNLFAKEFLKEAVKKASKELYVVESALESGWVTQMGMSTTEFAIYLRAYIDGTDDSLEEMVISKCKEIDVPKNIKEAMRYVLSN